jgi:hypothetical protein
MPGGWKNILGERWVRRPGLGLPADIIEDRLFVPAPVRPAPAGDRLYFHNVAMQFGGEWAKGINLSHAYAGSVFFDGLNILSGSVVQDEFDSYRYFPQISKVSSGGAILSTAYVTDTTAVSGAYTTDIQAVSGAAGYVFCAASSNESSDTRAPVLFAMSADLDTLLWAGTAPGIASDKICDVRPADDGNSAFFTGWKFSNSNRYIGICHQIDHTGAITRSWYADSVASGVHIRFFASAPGDNGSLYLFGATENGAVEGSLIVKFDSSNAVLWKKCFGGTPYSGSFGFVASTGNIYHAQTKSGGTTVLSRISSAGNVISQIEIYSGIKSVFPFSLINDGADGAYLLVRVLDPGVSDTLVLMRLDSSHSVLWQIEIYPTNQWSQPSNPSGGLATDGEYVYISAPSGKMLLKISADGITSPFTIDSGGPIYEAAVSQASLQTQAVSTTVTTITYGAGSGQFFSMTAAPSGFAIRSSGFTPALVDLSGFVLTGPPRQAQVEGSRFAGGFSVTTPSIYGMDRAAGSAQVDRSFASIASATGRQGVLLGVYVSPPLNAGQWIGDGDAALYIADSVSNEALDFTAGAPEVYIWRPSTYSRVGTLHSAAGERYGTPSTSEKVTVARFRPCPIFAKAGDVIVVELWGQVLSTGVPSYTGHAYLDGATINDTDNAAVSNYAANIRFSETLTFDISAQTYEVAITESATASATHGAVLEASITHVESAPVTVAVDGLRQVPAGLSEAATGSEASVSSAAFAASQPEASAASEEQRGGTPHNVVGAEPSPASSEQDTSSAAFCVQAESTAPESVALAVAAFSAVDDESASASSLHAASAVFVSDKTEAVAPAAGSDFSIVLFDEASESAVGSTSSDSVWTKGGAAVETVPAVDSPAATFVTASTMVDGDGDPWFNRTVMLLHCEGAEGSSNIVDVCGSAISLEIPGWGATPPVIRHVRKAFGGSSLYFGDTGANFYVTNNALDTVGDFTIEGWIWHDLLLGNDIIAIMSFGEDVLEIFDNFSLVAAGRFTVRNGAGEEITHQDYFAAGVWQHWAVVRKDGEISIFLNGIKSQYSPLSFPGSLAPQFGYINVGARGQITGNNFSSGYMDEIRISLHARYTGDFAVPTKAFPDYQYTGTIADVAINGGAPMADGIVELCTAADSRAVLKLKQGVTVNESATPASSANAVIADMNHQIEVVTASEIQGQTFSGLAGVVESSLAMSLASAGFQAVAVVSANTSADDVSGGLRLTGAGVSEQVFSAVVGNCTVQFVVQASEIQAASDHAIGSSTSGSSATEIAAALSAVVAEILGDSGKEYSLVYAVRSAATVAVMSAHSSVVVMLRRDDIAVKE